MERDDYTFARGKLQSEVMVKRRKRSDTELTVRRKSIKAMNFNEFWFHCSDVKNGKIVQRRESDKSRLVICVHPNLTYNPSSENFWYYCKNNLLRFKCFKGDIVNLIDKH